MRTPCGAEGRQDGVVGAPPILPPLRHLHDQHQGGEARQQPERDEHGDRRTEGLLHAVPLLRSGLGDEHALCGQRPGKSGEVAGVVEPDPAVGVEPVLLVRLVEGSRRHHDAGQRGLVGHRLPREDPDPRDRDRPDGRLAGIGRRHAHGEVLADLEAGGIGKDGVDEHLLGPIRVWQPAGDEGRELEGELIAGGRDHAAGERRVGLVDDGEVATLVAVSRDRRLGVEDLGRVLGREVVGHGGCLGVGRIEDAAVRRGGVTGAREAGQCEAEGQSQNHASPDESDEPSSQTMGDEVGDQGITWRAWS